jgi:hypothetical protein
MGGEPFAPRSFMIRSNDQLVRINSSGDQVAVEERQSTGQGPDSLLADVRQA